MVREAERFFEEGCDGKPIGDASDHGGLGDEQEALDENIIGEDHAEADGGEERQRGAEQNFVGGIPIRH